MTPQNRIRNLFELEGKVALITGASKGIGEAMARGLAEFGAKVVVSSRKADAVELVAESFRAVMVKVIAELDNDWQLTEDDVRSAVQLISP